MNTSIIVPFVLGFLLDHAAAAGKDENWGADETAFETWVEAKVPYLKSHPQADAMLKQIAHPMILAIAKITQDEPDLKAAILALAAKNLAAAGAALLALVKQAAPELAPFIGGAAQAYA